MTTPVSMVVFDLGGVVVRICRSIGEAGRLVGVDVPEDLLTPESRAERKALHRDYERGRIDCDQFFERAAATTRGRIDAGAFRAMHLAWITGEYPGVSELIHDLHRRGLETGVLSNTNASHWAQMQGGRGAPPGFPATTLPRHRHASHLLGVAKPDPAIYATFVERVKSAGVDVTTGPIVFFDDLEDNVLAARAAGWHAHQIDHTGDPAEQMRAHLRRSHGLDL